MSHHVPCGRPPQHHLFFGNLNYTAEQINQLLSMVPRKADRVELKEVKDLATSNFLGHLADVSLLPATDKPAWVLVGDLRAARPYIHYVENFVPKGYNIGWNDLTPVLGTYDLLGVNRNNYGYNVTVFGINGGTHDLKSAINDVPARFRLLGHKITFRTLKGNWETYHNESLSLNDYTNVECWVQETGLTTVEGNVDISINNNPDYEDLTEGGNNTLKFADKEYSQESFSGLGRVYLRKNIVNGVNVLTQDMISKENTIYIIQYAYQLQGETLNIPSGCVLKFDGGSVEHGTLVTDGVTLVEGNPVLPGIELQGAYQRIEDGTCLTKVIFI